MNQIASINNNLTMSSREIATLTDKQHHHVMRDIRSMLEELGEEQKPFLDFDNSGANGRRVEFFNLDRDHTECLLTGYSVRARMRVIKRWRELEESKPVRLPQTFSEALQLAADQAKRLELQAPKVAFVDNYVESSGNKTFREVAKLLKANERQFRSFMVANKIQYVLNGSWSAYQNHIDAGRFTHKTGEKNGHAYTECRFTPKGIQWISSLWENK